MINLIGLAYVFLLIFTAIPMYFPRSEESQFKIFGFYEVKHKFRKKK